MLYLPQYLPANIRLTILTNSVAFLLETAKISNHNWLVVSLGGSSPARGGGITIDGTRHDYILSGALTPRRLSPLNSTCPTARNKASRARESSVSSPSTGVAA